MQIAYRTPPPVIIVIVTKIVFFAHSGFYMQSVMLFRLAKMFVFQPFLVVVFFYNSTLSFTLMLFGKSASLENYENVFTESDEWLYRGGCAESPYMDKLWACIMLITYCKCVFAHL